MAELIGGALLGTAFGILYEGLKQLIRKKRESKNPKFGAILEQIISRLDSFKPLIQQMREVYSDEELQGLGQVIKDGQVLVGDCLVHGRNPNKKDADEFRTWDNRLEWQLQMLNLQSRIDVRKAAANTEAMLPLVRDTEAMVRGLRDTKANIEDAFKGLDWVKHIQSIDTEAYCAVPDPPSVTFGLDVPLKELKRKMFEDGESMIVVSAMGGSGKTTLAIKFCRDPEVREKFKSNIFFVTISRNFNLELIVQQLYRRKGLQGPDFINQENAVTWLQRFLRKEGQHPLLLVLDDFWSESESVLANFQCKEMENYKILVTSRSQLLRYASSSKKLFRCGSQDSQYKLELLNGCDAMELFNHSATLGDSSSDIPKLREMIVEYCKGLPLAITVVGGSLSGQPVAIWRERVIESFKGRSIIDSEAELRDCLQKSIDALDKKIKRYFLDLGAFPEDKKISVGALIDMWTGLYGLTFDKAVKPRCVDGLTHEDEDTVCIANLEKLKSRNLANLVDTRNDKINEDGYYNGGYVTQHDLLRELATHHSRLGPVEQRKKLFINIIGNDIPKWWRKQKYHHIQARLLSVSTDSVFSNKLPYMSLPEAEVLVLNFQTKKYVLPEFVENMGELKVLLVSYDGSSHAELDNFQLLDSLPNLKRIRLESISSIRSITENPFRLESLLKLSLFLCDFSRAFSNGFVKISDAFPNLEELNIDDCYSLKEFLTECCELVHLTKLSITKCRGLVTLPEGIGSLVKLEVLRLRSCTDLSIFPDSVKNLKNLKFLDISDCSSFGKLPKYIGGMSSLRKLDMRHCKYMEELPVSDLKQLEEVICSHKTKKLWEAVKPSLGGIRIVAMPLNWSDFYN